MASNTSTYSESWFRIAGQRVALRPHVRVHRQMFRGERWFVLRDPFSNQFFRVRPAAYEFLARLGLDRTVESVWNERCEADPLEAPGQEEVLRLLAQLYGANLLHGALPADSAQLFERYRKRRARETRAYLLNIMFARIPLFDPDAWLKRFAWMGRVAFSWPGLVIWLVAVLAGVKVVIDRGALAIQQSEGILSLGSLPLLYVGMVLVKTLHEFGHSFACRRFGGEVHTMGVMFLLFTPVPYMDATSSWAFRSRWKRAAVGAAGMYVEVFVAALAAFVWAATGPGAINSLAYNMMFVASVSTVLFNANPLLRFDGYYILSDLLDIPNLHQRATGQLKHFFMKKVCGNKDSQSPARSPREAWWLGSFAVASNVYKIFLFSAILLFLADRFLILGVIMTLICLISWILVPIGKLINFLATSPKLDRNRPRAVAWVVGGVAAILLFLALVPFPNRFRAPGVIEATERSAVAVQTEGWVAEVLAPSGSLVQRGQPLFRLANPELDLDIAAAHAQLAESRALELRAMQQRTADLAPIASRNEAIEKNLSRLQERRASLLVSAPHDGVWIAPSLADAVGAFVERGAGVGDLVNARQLLFSAIVSQTEASRLFEGSIRWGEIRLPGQAGTTIPISGQTIIPAERRRLPSAALGWRGGGALAVSLDDREGTRAAEPFFEVRAALDLPEGVTALQGQSGRLRFSLPPEPLLQQWGRKLRQLLQQRYGL
jgi:putative peptide zinc metalloprotease protein